MASSGAPGPDSGENDPYTDSGAKFGRLQMPKFDAGLVNLDSVASVYGVQGSGGGADYLDYNIKGRDWFEKTTYNTGVCYLLGTISGGAYGVVEGARNAPSTRARIRMNAILNGAGKRGSKLGNSLAVLAMLYTGVEHTCESYQVDTQLGVGEWINPIIAASTTGMLFKSTANVRTMLLAGVVGASGAGLWQATANALGGDHRR